MLTTKKRRNTPPAASPVATRAGSRKAYRRAISDHPLARKREWYGQGVEEPGAMGDGRTLAQCVRSVCEALAAVVASNLEHGEPVVPPIIDQERRVRRKAS